MADTVTVEPILALVLMVLLAIANGAYLRHLLPGWSVMDRLGDIDAPTLVIAGREDFVFPPESQRELVAGILDARLHIVERSGHNPQAERTDEVMRTVGTFLSDVTSPLRTARS